MIKFMDNGIIVIMLPKTFIFIGRSGCGKGTQADLLMQQISKIDKDKTLHIESGAFLREYSKGDSLSQKLCKEILDKGGLMPEFLVVNLWSNYLMKNITGDENMVFDGCPRKFHEALILDSVFPFYKREKPYVIFMNVSRKWAEERLLGRKRNDDNPEDIKARLDWYETDVLPSVNFYKESPNYVFLDINGERSVEEIHKEILEKVNIPFNE